MTKVICIGSTSKDIFFPTAEGKIVETPQDLVSQKKIAFELGAKFHINDRFESLGGCGANQSAGLARLGIAVSCYTAFGDDATADWLKKQFAKENIKTDLAERMENSLSGLSAIVVDQGSGERIIFSNQEANEKLRIDSEKLSGADFVSITDLSGDWQGIAKAAIDFCNRNNIKVAFNPRGRNIKENAAKVLELSGKCDIFFLNKDEAIEIVSCDISQADNNLNDEDCLLRELKKAGAKIVIITDGERGAWASDGKKVVHADAVKIEKVTDTTGSGDAFASAFLAAHIKGKDLETCVRWGVKNGANVVRFYGGVEGLMREEEISNF
jgi:sugar/nucleoside kinase (ribokinase family)